MILDVYTVVDLGKTLNGGTTQPLIATVMDKAGNYLKHDYVVKIFKQKNISQFQPTNKELYAYFLALEFDLEAPEAVLLYVSEEIIEDLQKREKYANFDLSAGYYYGCLYLENAISYEFANLDSFELWELANIFAFDALIRNIDRRTAKTNILVHENTFCLIDHELTLDVRTDCEFYLDTENWNSFIKERVGKLGAHIFYAHLKEVNKKKPIEFNEFREYLRTLNPRKVLSKIAAQLEDFEQDSDDVFVIIEYLECIKKHENEFINLLKQLLL
jgi:hypothetical protein